MLLFVLGGGAWAAYQFNDVTNVEAWKTGRSPWPDWIDVIGNPNNFDTFGANRSGDWLTIFTNWNPDKDGTLGVKTADLFINSDSIGAFEYAIRLDDDRWQSGWFMKTPLIIFLRISMGICSLW